MRIVAIGVILVGSLCQTACKTTKGANVSSETQFGDGSIQRFTEWNSDIVGGLQVSDWLEGAEQWYRSSEYPRRTQLVSSELIPKLLECFDETGEDFALADLSKENREHVQAQVVRCFIAMGNAGAAAVPRLKELLENRELECRKALVNALGEIGPRSRELVEVGLVDLRATSEQVRQQGILILWAAAAHDQSALSGLIQGTQDKSNLVRHTAIYLITRLRNSGAIVEQQFQKILDRASPDDKSYFLSTIEFLNGPPLIRGVRAQ